MKMRVFFSTLAGLLVLGVVVFLVGRVVLQAYLRSERFRHTISSATTSFLRASCDYEPFRFEGTSIYSDGVTANGQAGAAFAKLQLEQVRADLNLRGIFRNVWAVREVTVQQLAVTLDGPRPPVESAASSTAATQPNWLSRWLPKKVELQKVNVRNAELAWTGGALHGVQISAAPDGRTWQIGLQGGSVAQAGWPAVNLNTAHLRYNAPTLYINDAELAADEGGTANVTGEVNFPQSLELHCELKAISITPLLPPDWRAKLHGALTGTVKVQSTLPLQAPMLEGDVQLVNGRLEALPILDQIALFTGSQQFRSLDLSQATGKFQQSAGRLKVSKFVAESAGLLRVEGAFTIVNGAIDGTFQVGVTASSLRWLPGSQERVFNSSHDGYCWAPMRLTGPATQPNEDLSPRLIAAAKQKVIEDATGAVKQTTDSVLDLLKPLLQ
jgi:hypothetical protein